MPFLLLVFIAIQAAQPPGQLRGRSFLIMAPHGWAVHEAGADAIFEHATGASLRVVRLRLLQKIDSFARDAAERVMRPLGFAKLGEPLRFQDSDQEWVQYEIRGNRLSDRRRILYRAVRRHNTLFEVVYENNEDRFDFLLTEAQSMASSVLQSLEENEGAAQFRNRAVRRDR